MGTSLETQCRRPLVLFNALVLLSVSRSVHKIFAIKPLSRQEIEKMHTILVPNCLGGITQTFLWWIVSAVYCPPLGKVWLSCVC